MYLGKEKKVVRVEESWGGTKIERGGSKDAQPPQLSGEGIIVLFSMEAGMGADMGLPPDLERCHSSSSQTLSYPPVTSIPLDSFASHSFSSSSRFFPLG